MQCNGMQWSKVMFKVVSMIYSIISSPSGLLKGIIYDTKLVRYGRIEGWSIGSTLSLRRNNMRKITEHYKTKQKQTNTLM